jgi:hypothetical protein
VLIVRTKTITIDEHPVKVFSLDGKLWFSRPGDFEEFRRRRTKIKSSTQKWFSEHLLDPVVTYDADFWRR